MARKHRYTGRLPPLAVLKKCPNWIAALDEEGEDGQDESTIKPDDVQDRIGADTISTVAEVVLPNGRRRSALLSAVLGLCDGDVEYLDVYDGKLIWQVELSTDSWGPSRWARATKQLNDESVFPLHVRTRLPSSVDGEPLDLALHLDGSLTSVPRKENPVQPLDLRPTRLPFDPIDISASLDPGSTPTLATQDGSPTAEWVAGMCDSILAKGYFSILFWSSYDWRTQQHDARFFQSLDGKPLLTVAEVIKTNVQPALEAAEFCNIGNVARGFELFRPAPPRAPWDADQYARGTREGWVTTYTRRKGKQVLINLAEPSAKADIDFCWWMMRRHMGLVIGLQPASIATKRILRGAIGVHQISNLGAVLPRPAMSLAQRKTAAGGLVCLCPDATGNMVMLHLFAAPEEAVRAFLAVLKDAKLEDLCWQRGGCNHYRALTFDPPSARAFLFEVVKRNDPRLLVGTLWRAVRNLSDGGAAARALAAAELVAAIWGRPARRFDFDDAMEVADNEYKASVVIRTWVGQQSRPDRDTLALARDVVAIIADQSPLPRELFRTSEARAVWREGLTDLHSRLKLCLQ